MQDAALITLFSSAIESVEYPEEALFMRRGMAKNRTAQGWGQGQRHHNREQHCRDNRHRELAINDAGRAAKERHRQEYRRQNKSDSHQRTSDFPHRFFGSFARGQPFIAHNTLDVFHHHNGVIDQQAYRQHHCKQRQRIDGVAKQRQHAKSTEQHDRNRQRRNQRGAKILQEQVHHADHQNDGFKQRLNHILYGDLNKFGAVFRIRHVIALRHIPFKFSDFIFYQRGGIQRVRPRRKHDRNPRSRMTVEFSDGGVVFTAHLHARHILDAYHGPVRLAFDNDLFELFYRLQARLRANRSGQLLCVRGR